jgi:hypothetical protein
MSDSLLKNTLSTIKTEWNNHRKFDESFNLVDQLFRVYGEDNLAERLSSNIPLEYSWEVVANLFAILIWSMNDKGASALIATTEDWFLEGNDLRKVQIALNLDIYPFRNKNKMVEVLSSLSESYPEIISRCKELVASRIEEE